MRRGNYWRQDPDSAEMVDKSNSICCVSSLGKRKKRYTDKAYAAAVALNIHGKYYQCMFQRGTYHVTTTSRRRPIQPGEPSQKGKDDAKIKGLQAKMEVAIKELVEIQQEVRGSSFNQLKRVSLTLLERQLHLENTVRQMEVELAAMGVKI